MAYQFTATPTRQSTLPMITRSMRAIAALLIFALPVGCSTGGPDLQRAADTFSAPSKWNVLTDEEVSDPLCIGSRCKAVVIAWSAAAAPSAQDFDSLMRQADWTDIEMNDCQVRPDATGPVPFCRATAASDGVRIELTAAGPLADETSPYLITLRVEPKSP